MAIYDLSNIDELVLFNSKVNLFKAKKVVVELTEKKRTRTLSQNNSIHLYCEMISDALNELGWTFRFVGIKGVEMELKYTPTVVKETIWRPIQKALFNKESTKELTTIEVSDVAQQIEMFFANQGINLPFPSIENLSNEY